MTPNNTAVATTDPPPLREWPASKCPLDANNRPVKCWENPHNPGVLAICLENMEAIGLRPLLMLRPSVRQALMPVWSMNEEIYKTPGPLAMILAVFIQMHGLREEDAVEVLHNLTRPGELAELAKASDVKTRIAVGAKQMIQKRKSEEQTERLRLEAKQADRTGGIKLTDIFKEAGSA